MASEHEQLADVVDLVADAIWETDADLRVRVWRALSPGMPLLLEPDTYLGEMLVACGANGQDAASLVSRMRRTGRLAPTPLRPHASGVVRCMTAKPVRDAGGAIAGFRGVIGPAWGSGRDSPAHFPPDDAGRATVYRTVGHQIRQSIVAIDAAVALARDGTSIEPIELASRAIADLDWFIGRLLDLARLGSEEITPKTRTFRVEELIRRVVDEYVPLATAKGLQLDSVPTRAVVTSDPNLLGMIVRNLVSNAIKYTESGRVLVGCRHERHAIRLMVVDTGIGIPEDECQAVFREFYCASNHPGESGRHGLGLAIVAEAARVLGHDLRLRSAVGRGSAFGIRIPRGNPDAAETLTAPYWYDQPPNLHGLHVLVVHDSAAACTDLAERFMAWGADVTAAGTGSSLLPADEPLPVPDLIVCGSTRVRGRRASDVVQAIRLLTGRDAPALVLGDPGGWTPRHGMLFAADPDWASHLPNLVRAALLDHGPV